MASIEAVLTAEMQRLPGSLASPCQRIAGAGGKRLRPALVLLAGACAGRPCDSRHVRAAAAVEALHLATLVHDDLIEGARTRRGVPTVNAAEGLSAAVLAGDALLGSAGRIAAGLHRRAAELMSQALLDLAAGQALEEQLRFRADAGADAVLAVARGKAGTLTRLACQLAVAVTPEMDRGLAGALEEFGLAFGTCLQLIDDVLDLVAVEERLGKPVGVDFAAGVVTLPTVVALGHDRELRGLLRPGITTGERDRALHLLRHGGGIAAAVRTAEHMAQAACARLTGLRDRGDQAAITRLAEMLPHYVSGQLAATDPALRDLLDRGTRAG
jgi:heptaprenyl diphosphate synthase